MFVNQKSQEISYALIRVAAYIRRQDLRQRIEKLAFQLVEEIGLDNLEAAIKTSNAIEGLITIGKSIYEIEPTNAKVIIGELNSLTAFTRQSLGIEGVPQIESVFSKPPAIVEKIEEEVRISANGQENGNGNGNGINAAIRQSAILEKIRQSGNRQIQLKDIIAEFPEVSERTMRYDLQKLCNQGIIERIGNGGPGSYYALKAS